jgi:hypothetical protein
MIKILIFDNIPNWIISKLKYVYLVVNFDLKEVGEPD